MNRLLIITRNAWNNNISTGNTMSNFFGEWPGEIANLYCREEYINNNICTKYYKITEHQLINWLKNGSSVGEYFVYKDKDNLDVNIDKEVEKKEKRKYDFFRNHRYIVFLWLRELLWSVAKWDNKRLDDFLYSFRPDYILIPLYDCLYMYKILFYIQSKTAAKVVIYTGDDMYTLKQFSLSPLFWVDRIIRRRYIRKAISISSYRFCLCDKQSGEYSRLFKCRFNTHMKGISHLGKVNQTYNNPVIIHYAGNIYPGRWKTIASIGISIKNINKVSEKCRFEVYSNNVLPPKIKKIFDDIGICFKGSVDKNELDGIQKNADILVHAESFNIKNKLKTRLSVSTKIIDYLSLGKCILAVGPADIASIEYLTTNDIAVVVNNKNMLNETVKKLVVDENMRREYAVRALEYAKNKHDIHIIRKALYYGIMQS